MFKIVTISDVVRIPPGLFNESLEKAAKTVLAETYQGQIIENIGLIVSILDVKVSEIGKIILGDGGLYHKATFKALVFIPVLHEVVEGEVITVEDFGLFVRIGPLEGFIHRSQIYDDQFSYDKVQNAMLGRNTRYIIRKGDAVRARIVAVSLNVARLRGIRVGLTMRQPFLGKIEWIKKEISRLRKPGGE